MRLSPIRTLPLRASLRVQGQKNARSKANVEKLAADLSPWSSRLDVSLRDATLEPNIHPYPGIGHQLSSWIAGFLWAQDLGIAYVGAPLLRDEKNLFKLPSGKAAERNHPPGRLVRLGAVGSERDPKSLQILRGQIVRSVESAKGHPLRFRLALDQGRWDQTPAQGAIRAALIQGSFGDRLSSIERSEAPYIALHIRRGDIAVGSEGGSSGHSRWTDEAWYVALVRQLRAHPALSNMEIRAYALGDEGQFKLLRHEGVRVHLNGSWEEDFIEMCGARVLVAAPSSFSFSAGLGSSGVVLSQHPWWHRVPDDGRWVQVDTHGRFDPTSLDRAVNSAGI